MSNFYTTITKAQRNAHDFYTSGSKNGHEISICSRHHTKRPGYNPSPYEPKVVVKKQQIKSIEQGLIEAGIARRPSKQEAPHAKLQVRPETKRGQKSIAPTPKDILLPELLAETFFEISCELTTPPDVFIAIHSLSKGKPCVGCVYDSTSSCKAKQQLLRERGLIK